MWIVTFSVEGFRKLREIRERAKAAQEEAKKYPGRYFTTDLQVDERMVLSSWAEEDVPFLLGLVDYLWTLLTGKGVTASDEGEAVEGGGGMKIVYEINEAGQIAGVLWRAEEVAPNGGCATYGHVRLQDGPVKEKGVNGVQADDLLIAALEVLRSFNEPPHANRQTSLAITRIEEALHWLEDRTREREARGVEGTSEP